MPHSKFLLNNTSEDSKVWRYLPFTKFVAMLRDQALFFSTPSRLGDPFEGSLTAEDIYQLDLRELKDFRDFAGPVGMEFDDRWDAGDSMIDYLRARNEFKQIRRSRLLPYPPLFQTYVNCWHKSEVESAAMWDIYARRGEGVAIQSSLGQMIDAFKPTSEDIHIGEVSYLDYTSGSIGSDNTLDRLLTKRKSFEYEQELRAICFPDWDPAHQPQELDPDDVTPGRNISVDLDTLIEKVFVAPGAPSWFNHLIQGVIDDYNLTSSLVAGSSLDDRPLFR